MSNSRKSTKAMHCQSRLSPMIGVSRQSTPQNGTISPRAVPVFSMATMPRTKPSKMMRRIADGDRLRSSVRKLAQANRVPIVPGAKGEKPLPKPSAITCNGCDSMKRRVGCSDSARVADGGLFNSVMAGGLPMGSGKVVKSAADAGEVHGLMLCIDQLDGTCVILDLHAADLV